MQKYQAFSAVAELRSMTAAAEKLGYTQSGISHQIKAMEQELGLPLLKRTKYGVELTAEGTELLPAVGRLLLAEQEIREQAAALRKAYSGKLTVATFSSAMLRWLPEILERFSGRYPEIEISVVNGTYPEVVESLLSGTADCGFVNLPADPKLKVWPLKKDPMYVVVHEEDDLCAYSELTAEQLADKTFIVSAEGMDYDIGSFFTQAGVSPKLYLNLKTSDDYSALAMVKSRHGFTILPELLVEALPMERLRAIPLRNFQREIGIAVRESRSTSPMAEAFLSCVRTVLS